VARGRVDDPIDRLYGLPLADFTPERNALARRLRAEGDKERAAEVAALKKPVLAAWAVNRLVRTKRKDIDALVAAAAAIRKGKKDADERFRETVERLTKAARDLLADTGREPTDAVVRDVATTLRSAAAAEPAALAQGRLVQPVEASGFAAMAGAVLAPPGAARSETRAAPPRRDAAKLARLRKALGAARDEALRLRREAERAERVAKDARAKADDADRRVETASEALAEAQGRR
jgi:hypothetical protein